MKICFIAPANNYHTQKWCHWFRDRGHQVDVISFTEGEIDAEAAEQFAPAGRG